MMNKTQAEINQELHNALYGTADDIGLIAKTNEVWEILSAFKLFGRAVMWTALFLGGIGTFWAAAGNSIKNFFSHK